MSTHPKSELWNPSHETRFKTGNTEHRKSRNRTKKAEADYGDALVDMLATVIPVSRKGRKVYMSRAQALIDSLVANALKGDVTAADSLIDLYEKFKMKGDLQPEYIIIFPTLPEGQEI